MSAANETTSLKDLGRKCFRLRRGYGGQVAFTKLDPGEIRRVKSAAFASRAR